MHWAHEGQSSTTVGQLSYNAVACNATVETEDWLLDTAATNHMINKVGKRRAIEGTERKTNLLVDTANGSVEINESVSAELPIVGRLQDCLEINESPNLISLGTMVEDEGFDCT